MTPSGGYRRLFDLRLGGRARADAEMDLEIESHLEMRVADLVRAGWSPDAAREEAMRRFGHFATARQQLHMAARQREAATRQRDWFGSLVSDVRYAIRQAKRAPGFTALAVATLALGIGASTTMFTLVEHVLLRPLPFPHAEQLFSVTGLDSARNRISLIASADWLEWRRAQSLQGSAIYSFPFRQGVLTTDSATRVSAARVSGNFFDVLKPDFVIGRPFTEDEALDRSPVVVISERLWRRMFSADSRLATPLRTVARSYTIVGVVADGREFPAGTDAWFPVGFTLATDPARVNVNWNHIARIRPGVTRVQVEAELTTIARGIRATDPSALYDFGAGVVPLGQAVVGEAATYLSLLMAVVFSVLLIVCANVAAAGMARAAARSREMAIRTSLGAVRGRLIQQLLIEHVCLGMLAGGIALFIAWASVRGILSVWGGQIPRAAEVSVDAGVFVFALLMSVMSGVLAGVLPSLSVSRVSLSGMLSSGGRTAARGGRNLAGASLVAGEIAVAVLLLTGAGLLIRSFRTVLGRDIGFDTNVATAEVALSGATYATDTSRRYAYWDALLESYRTIPGVKAVGAANWIPLGITGQSFIDIGGRNVPGAGAVYRSVSEGFFQTLNVRLLAGRIFDRQDGAKSERVAVINQRLASLYWPNESPVGKQVRARSMEAGPRGAPAPWLTIIGVVGDVRTFGLESEARPELYVLFRQTPSWSASMTVLVRGSAPATRLLREMRARALAIDPRVAADVGTLDARLQATLASRILTMSLLTGLAGLALVLAALGIYGVLSYSVTQRTRELAVRAALGAERGQLLRLVIASGSRVVLLGMLLGVAASLALTRLLASMLVEVDAIDAVSFVAAVIVLAVVAFVAILIPAVRATRLDPLIALQAE